MRATNGPCVASIGARANRAGLMKQPAGAVFILRSYVVTVRAGRPILRKSSGRSATARANRVSALGSAPGQGPTTGCSRPITG